MKLVFFDARVWRYVVSAISKIIEEGAFIVDNEGLRFKAMDPSHVVMIDYFIPSSAFEEFEVEGEEAIGVNFEDITKIMRRATKEDKLGLETEGSKLIISLIGKGVRKFILPQLSLTTESLPEPQIEFNVKVRILSDLFKDMVKDLEPIGDILYLEASEEEFKAKATSDLGEAEVVIDRESGNIIDFEVKEPSKASYSIDYFVDMSAATNAANTVSIEFSTDMPSKIEFELPQEGRLTFYVAPRVE